MKRRTIAYRKWCVMGDANAVAAPASLKGRAGLVRGRRTFLDAFRKAERLPVILVKR